MHYSNITSAKFISRPNRFIANVSLNGIVTAVHVKNTGRCRELLLPGTKVYLTKTANPERKTLYDLVCVEKRRQKNPPLLINMDSQIPNAAAEEWLRKGELFGKNAKIRREVQHGDSRFDFEIENENGKTFLEVKGVTLEKDGLVLFPDAPTERGVRHIKGLMKCLDEGFRSCLLFVIQMQGIRAFSPNDETHPEFGKTLRDAARKGVRILAMDCETEPDSMVIRNPVRIIL